jgi:hypothetical protein
MIAPNQEPVDSVLVSRIDVPPPPPHILSYCSSRLTKRSYLSFFLSISQQKFASRVCPRFSQGNQASSLPSDGFIDVMSGAQPLGTAYTSTARERERQRRAHPESPMGCWRSQGQTEMNSGEKQSGKEEGGDVTNPPLFLFSFLLRLGFMLLTCVPENMNPPPRV